MMSNEKDTHVKEGAVKHKDTVLSSIVDNITLTHFEEQKRILNTEFQDIEDQIVGFYLMTKPDTRTTKRVRQKVQKQLLPLYKMVIRPIENLVYETTAQLKNDPSDAETISKVNHSAGEVKVMEESMNINE